MLSETKILDTSQRVEIKRGDTVLHSSQNLRGLIEHQNRVGIDSVSVIGIKEGAIVYVSFKDQSYCRTRFADFSVALSFVHSRHVRWGLDLEIHHSDTYRMFMETPTAKTRGKMSMTISD